MLRFLTVFKAWIEPRLRRGRYEIVHRGYRLKGDGYGVRDIDSYLSQGKHSRTFRCRDRTGPLGIVIVKVKKKCQRYRNPFLSFVFSCKSTNCQSLTVQVARARKDDVRALRDEAGVLASLAMRRDDPRAQTYLPQLVDSFDVPGRFALAFR